MPENRENGKAPITLEQLLALKRSERPDGAFWEEFDHEFQRRRLASLVNTTPWYLGAIHGFVRASRWLAPAAVVAAAGVLGYFELASNTGPMTRDSSPEVAEIDRESRFTVLEAEYVSPVKQSDVAVSAVDTPGFERVRYGVREIGMSPDGPRQFLTVASPHVLSVSDEDSGSYLVRTLTAVPAFGAGVRPAAASF